MRKRKLMKTGIGDAIPGFDKILDIGDTTKRQYGAHIRCFLSKALQGRKMTRRRIESIRWDQVIKFLGSLAKEKKKRGSQRNYRCALKTYFTTALGKFEGEFGKLRAEKKRPRKEKEILDKEEYNRLWTVLPEKFQLLFDFMLGCGLRIQELLDLRVEDVVMKGKSMGKIFVRNGKGNKPRLTTLTTKAMVDKVVDYVCSKRMKTEDILFTNRWGKPYKSSHSLNKTLQVYCGRANPPITKRITCHSFRHMFCT